MLSHPLTWINSSPQCSAPGDTSIRSALVASPPVDPAGSALPRVAGSAFPFDGLPVPFNHQNEWAWALFETARIDPRWQSHPSFQVAKEVIEHFAAHILRDMQFPADGRWPYWWGRAVEGWTAADGVSINTPEYPGDKGHAWISFRTIDLFGVLSARFFMSSLQHRSLLDSASALWPTDWFTRSRRGHWLGTAGFRCSKPTLRRDTRGRAHRRICGAPCGCLVVLLPNRRLTGEVRGHQFPALKLDDTPVRGAEERWCGAG